jgi:hypothetical protein
MKKIDEEILWAVKGCRPTSHFFFARKVIASASIGTLAAVVVLAVLRSAGGIRQRHRAPVLALLLVNPVW